DVIDPVWIRIFGFSGLNQLYSIPGTFFSGRAAYEVYKHLDLFKSSSNSASEHVIDHDNIHQQRNTSRDHFSTQNKAYSLTRDAAIRM
ncbi:3747_t:CDS:2, partial [Gigaspora rosea]